MVSSGRQQNQEHIAEGRPRQAILDDPLDVRRQPLELARELTTVEEPAEDFQEKIEKPKAQFNPANMEIAIRKLIFFARHNSRSTITATVNGENMSNGRVNQPPLCKEYATGKSSALKGNLI